MEKSWEIVATIRVYLKSSEWTIKMLTYSSDM